MPFSVSIPVSFGTVTITGDTPEQVLEQLRNFDEPDVVLLQARAQNLRGISEPTTTELDAHKVAEAVLRETIVVDKSIYEGMIQEKPTPPAKKPKKIAAEPKPPKMNGTKKVDAPVSLPAVDVAQLRSQAVVWMDDVYRAGDEKDDDSGIDRVVDLLKQFGAKSSKDIPDDQFADFAASVKPIHAEHVGS